MFTIRQLTTAAMGLRSSNRTAIQSTILASCRTPSYSASSVRNVSTFVTSSTKQTTKSNTITSTPINAQATSVSSATATPEVGSYSYQFSLYRYPPSSFPSPIPLVIDQNRFHFMTRPPSLPDRPPIAVGSLLETKKYAHAIANQTTMAELDSDVLVQKDPTKEQVEVRQLLVKVIRFDQLQPTQPPITRTFVLSVDDTIDTVKRNLTTLLAPHLTIHSISLNRAPSFLQPLFGLRMMKELNDTDTVKSWFNRSVQLNYSLGDGFTIQPNGQILPTTVASSTTSLSSLPTLSFNSRLPVSIGEPGLLRYSKFITLGTVALLAVVANLYFGWLDLEQKLASQVAETDGREDAKRRKEIKKLMEQEAIVEALATEEA